MNSLKDLFLLDPDVVFLNHGSFGACPRPVFEAYQAWQKQLEQQPVAFLGRMAEEHMAVARRALAGYLGVMPDEIVYFTNPTTAMNMVARSLDLKPGDEILTTDHEYGAMDRTWRYICQKTGAVYRQAKIELPLTSTDEFLEAFWSKVNDRTRVVFISHITSPTAVKFPIESVCYQARQSGILSIVDGAHAPGQLYLDLTAVGADLYTGACHKWLMAPKGSAFLYARPELQEWLMPLVVSWGYQALHPSHSQFIDYHEWQGTRDLAAFLATPAAIEFQADHDWPTVQTRCHEMALDARRRINAVTGLDPVCPEETKDQPYQWFHQMFTARLPGNIPPEIVKARLYDEHRVEAPIIDWNGQLFIRVSIQGYNSPEDISRLVDALTQIYQ